MNPFSTSSVALIQQTIYYLNSWMRFSSFTRLLWSKLMASPYIKPFGCVAKTWPNHNMLIHRAKGTFHHLPAVQIRATVKLLLSSRSGPSVRAPLISKLTIVWMFVPMWRTTLMHWCLDPSPAPLTPNWPMTLPIYFSALAFTHLSGSTELKRWVVCVFALPFITF